MNLSECHHVRIRGKTEHGVNVEKFIKTLGNQYKIDVANLPQLEKKLHRLHASDTYCKRKIQDAKLRKKLIIKKLYLENTRISPFEMSLNLARTAKTWEAISKTKKRKVITKPMIEPEVPKHEEEPGETRSVASTAAHPNTEEGVVDIDQPIVLKSEVETEVGSVEVSHLPPYISLNQHKIISPLRSEESMLCYKSIKDKLDLNSQGEFNEWLSLERASFIKLYFPREIAITKNMPGVQHIHFALINCSTDFVYLQFKRVTDKSRFKIAKVIPETPLKLYPGLAAKYDFIFRLITKEQKEDFSSALFFKVGKNIYTDSLTQACLIPVVSKFIGPTEAVSISDKVYFTPKYSWHINGTCGYPTGMVKITVHTNRKYILRVSKRAVDFVQDPIELLSVVAIGPHTQSLIERIASSEPSEQSKIITPKTMDLPPASVEVVESLNTIDFITMFLEEIVCLALEPFMFEHTYLELGGCTTYKIPVYFTEAEHIGYHQCFYDLDLCDVDTDNILMTKTVLLLAEVLPHPIQIYPQLLDMSQSPIVHGFCEDRIFINNTHKLYHVTAKIKVTTKMQKLFRLTPPELSVAPGLQGHFHIRICSRELLKFGYNKKCQDLVHFTVKIIFSGHKAVYYNIPPLYYEIIAPCAADFKMVYNEKYFKEIPYGGLQETSSV